MLGEKNFNTFGTEMQVIAYRNSNDIDVMFLDSHGYVYQHNTMSNFKRSTIKNPFDPILFGKGYLGIGKYKTSDDKKMTAAYRTWRDMFTRCYNKEHHSYYPLSDVCEEWMNFQNFAEWYYANQYEVKGRLHIDKDILYPGNKFYSPYHCLLVPQRINMLFTNKSNKRGLPNGIKRSGNKYQVQYNTQHLGATDTLEKAYELYAKRKKEIIVEVANEYRDRIPNKVYQALLNYEVRIENDKNYTSTTESNI